MENDLSFLEAVATCRAKRIDLVKSTMCEIVRKKKETSPFYRLRWIEVENLRLAMMPLCLPVEKTGSITHKIVEVIKQMLKKSKKVKMFTDYTM